MAIFVFLLFVGMVLGLSFYFARRTKSASSYYAAGGTIHWSVNGIAFAGDYLSAASFLGICGMIATVGYDGFLYSIGYLAGWIVALFVVAEPMKRLGKYTFTDAIDSKYNSRGIKLLAAISTLVVSICYLIPQMVGAGVLVEPLLGLPHAVGVILVGAIVITIVATAGMTSTTYVQFLKGGMLIIFSLIVVVAVCYRGLSTTPDQIVPGKDGKIAFKAYPAMPAVNSGGKIIPADPSWQVAELAESKTPKATFARLVKDGQSSWWQLKTNAKGQQIYQETQWESVSAAGVKEINGAAGSADNQLRYAGNLESIQGKTGAEAKTGSLSPFRFLEKIGAKDTVIRRWSSATVADSAGSTVTVYYPIDTPGDTIMRPGLRYKLVNGTPLQKLDFISLMLALFCGTAALPHILIRYYTVPSPESARKSTIVAIAGIGFFYILTLFLGLGAMVNGVVNLTDNNMSAPLLAKSFGTLLFAIISAIAFATVLGTVSGLIVAASGAVAHDLMDRYAGINMTDNQKVRAGKITAFLVGILAIILGILFKGMNVNFLVGLAFAVAASANLPAIVMLLFWKKTTAKGIVVSIAVGILTALGLILLSPSMYKQYGLDPSAAPVPFDNPGFVSIPLSFITLVVVSLLTQKRAAVQQ
jgi:cation/acetate symporter